MLIYPAIFHRTIEGGYIVVFPDFNDGATEGQTLEQAMEMAEDYIGTYLYDDFIKGKELPKASDINKISIEIPEDEKEFYIEGESFKTLVSLDMMKYVNECKSATVRKNVTIPSWLNEMGKNHKLAKSISDVSWSEFIRQLEYKANWYGRKVVRVPTFYPSSKTCSCCGTVKETLKLSERIYKCECCGLEIDRDYNASINLEKVKIYKVIA